MELSEMPTSLLTGFDKAVDDDLEMLCPVCFLDDDSDIELVTTACNHTFCRPCFIKIQQKNMICAICRADLVEKPKPVKIEPSKMVDNISSGCLPKRKELYDYRGCTSWVPWQYQPIGIESDTNPIVEQEVPLQRTIDKDYSLIIIEKDRKCSFTWYDIVAYDASSGTLYETHSSVPIGKVRHLPPYLECLLKGAKTTHYESKYTSDTLKIVRLWKQRRTEGLKFGNVVSDHITQPWKEYQFTNLVYNYHDWNVPNL